MSDKREASPEIQQFIKDLDMQKIKMTVLDKGGLNAPSFEDDEEKEFNPILQFIAKIFYKLMLYIGVLLTLVGFANIYGAYMMYQGYKSGGIMGIVNSKWLIFLVGYAVFMFLYKKVHYALYKYYQGVEV